ncbi:MAG: glycosyl hydrolase family 28-related protein, partial [Eubacteriales bacterium]
MNKKVRILISWLLLMAMALGVLVSCNSQEEADDTDTEVSDSETETEKSTSDKVEYTVPEATGDEHTVIYPMANCYTESNVARIKANGYDVPLIVGPGVYDYCNFSFDSSVSIIVEVNETIKNYSVSPLAKEIPSTVSGKKLEFTLSESVYVIVKINNLREIIIAADTLEADKPASRGDGIYNVLDYGADPTGEVITSSEINNAIRAANEAGGGIVYVPAGVYTVTNI